MLEKPVERGKTNNNVMFLGGDQGDHCVNA